MLRFLRSRRNRLGERRRRKGKIEWLDAPDVKERLDYLLKTIEIDWIRPERVICFRSTDAATRAYARIWGLGKVWQQALNLEPAYVLEVISEKFDKLPQIEQDKVLLHEVTHIPKNFSGSLVPHIRRGKRNFHDQVERLIAQYLKNR